MYEAEIKVKYSEMDFNLALKPSALLNFLQDMASDNAEKLGFGYSYITPKNLAWFLLKYHMEFENYPVGEYDLLLKTEPRGYNKIFAYRDFEIHAKDRRIAKIASTWSLVDINSSKVVPVDEALENNPKMPLFQKREGDLAYNKIAPLGKIDVEKSFEIRYDDIDVNHHVNNSNYIIWAFELLDLNFRRNRLLKTLDIVFKKEIKYGHRVLSQLEFENENLTLHRLKNEDTGEDLCFVRAEWN